MIFRFWALIFGGPHGSPFFYCAHLLETFARANLSRAMAMRVSTSHWLLSLWLIAAAELLSGCMPYGETALYQIYKTDAERCSQNETDACVALLQTKCEAPVRVCTNYVPDFQAQASQQLTKDCQNKDEAACQALAALACDHGDSSVCSTLGTRYSELYSSCKACNPSDSDS